MGEGLLSWSRGGPLLSPRASAMMSILRGAAHGTGLGGQHLGSPAHHQSGLAWGVVGFGFEVRLHQVSDLAPWAPP